MGPSVEDEREDGGHDPKAARADATQRLVRCLEENTHFRRDGRIGRIFHPGRISFREVKARDSLHIVIDKGRVSAHVDEVCPIRICPDGTASYGWRLVIAHNLSGMAADLGRRLRGRHGEQRCTLGCEMTWVDEDQVTDQVAARSKAQPSDPGTCERAR